jgi:hypothetical protein
VLVDVLPPLVHVGAGSGTAGTIRAALELLRAETDAPGLGTPFVTERPAHVLLVHLLRAHVAERGIAGGVWLTALADRQIGAALALMHGTPAHRWTVAGLAAKVGSDRAAARDPLSRPLPIPAYL